MANKPRGKTPNRSKAGFQVKPVSAASVAAIILESLSHKYSSHCNYLDAVKLLREGEIFLAHESVLQQNIRVHVVSPEMHWVQNQATAAVKKLVDPQIDREREAIATWLWCEERCRKLNKKFDLLEEYFLQGETQRSPYHREMGRMRLAIQFVLGTEPPLDDITECAYYGPGSTTDVKGAEVHYVRKLEAEECVSSCVELASKSMVHDKAIWEHLGLNAEYSHLPSARDGFIRLMQERLASKIVTADDLMFVHKNIATKRSICAQPTASGSVQLGIHVVVARLLSEKAGVDLSDQGWNQKLASQGSRQWEDRDPYCTLDKENASALLCKSLPRVLFPPAWYKILMRTRTPNYKPVRGMFDPPRNEVPYEMYGGMGNGTTFCIQTLVFWAGAFATSGCKKVEDFVESRSYAVYGDDVVLRKGHAKKYMQLMQYLGFRFNKKKTFTDGPFRESCGADFYAGVYVRPATVSSETGVLTDLELIGIHNTLADGAFPLDQACERIRSLWKKCIYPRTPTDPAGNLGFRPVGVPYYSIVRDRDGTAILSAAWQRPRTYVMEVRAKYAQLGVLDPYTQIAVALLRARQSSVRGDVNWSLPFRGLVNTRVVPETDLKRDDLVKMMMNQLQRLAKRKGEPWWEAHRGLV